MLILGVFIIDLIIPLGVAVGVLYVCALAIVKNEERRIILYLTILVTFLTAIIPVITLTDQTTWMAFVNRGISILAIWILYGISAKYSNLKEVQTLNKTLNEKTEDLKRTNTELEQFAYVASHDLKSPIKNIVGLLTIINKK